MLAATQGRSEITHQSIGRTCLGWVPVLGSMPTQAQQFVPANGAPMASIPPSNGCAGGNLVVFRLGSNDRRPLCREMTGVVPTRILSGGLAEQLEAELQGGQGLPCLDDFTLANWCGCCSWCCCMPGAAVVAAGSMQVLPEHESLC